MKLKIVLGSLTWLIVLTLAHAHLNVGWERLASRVRVMLGTERAELAVGFLPVT